jgi:predicted MFS family arabinose efflux permease
MTITVGYVLRIAPEGHVAKLLSFHQTAILLAVTAGPGLGGGIAQFFGIRGTFLAYGAFALIGIGPSLRWLPGTAGEMDASTSKNAEVVRRERRQALVRLFRHRSFVIVMVVGFAIFALRAGYGNTVLPLFAVERFGLTEGQVGLLLTVAAIGNLVILWHAGTTVDGLGRRTVLVRSMVVMTIVAAGFLVMVDVWIIFVISFALGAVKGYAAVVPHAVLSDLADPRVRNTGVAILRMTTDTGILVGPVASGALVDAFGFQTAFVFALATVLVVTLATFAMQETSAQSRPRPA